MKKIELEYIKRICCNWEKFCFSNKLLNKAKSEKLRLDFERQYLMNRPISAMIKDKEIDESNVRKILNDAIDDEIDKYALTQYVIRDTFARFGLEDDESDEYYEAYEYQCESFRLILKSTSTYILNGKFEWYDVE